MFYLQEPSKNKMLAFRHMKKRDDRALSLPADIGHWSKMGLFLDERRRVCCFCCGFCTSSWSADDNPWKFHVRCDFAAFNSGHPLPRQVDDEVAGEPACVICFEKKIASVFAPCRHAVCCRACSLRCFACPTCRSKVLERLCIFLP
jgi:hypothetical protein